MRNFPGAPIRSLVRLSNVSPVLVDYPTYLQHQEGETLLCFPASVLTVSQLPARTSDNTGWKEALSGEFLEDFCFISKLTPTPKKMLNFSSCWRMTPSFSLISLLLLATFLLKGLRVSGSPACASCGLPAMEKDAEQKMMIEIAKQHLLEKLHLKERPNITQTVPKVALLTALRKLHSGRVRQDGTLELENSLPTKDQGYEIVSFADISDSDSGDKASLSLTFQFLQERGKSIQVLQSSLWIYAKLSEDPHRSSRLLARVFLSTDEETSDSNRTLVIEKMIEVKESNWHTFPITHTLQTFLDGGQRRLRLEVSCEEGERNLCSFNGSTDKVNQPFMVAQVRLRDDHSKHLIRKRSLRCGDEVTVCCKRDFYIKFKDIQWDEWIIAPEGYHMNYCMGQCPQHLAGSPGIASSFHATVFNQLKVNGINTATASCCIPTERRPLSMVYFNSQHSIVKTDVPDMIVESCGCT